MSHIEIIIEIISEIPMGTKKSHIEIIILPGPSPWHGVAHDQTSTHNYSQWDYIVTSLWITKANDSLVVGIIIFHRTIVSYSMDNNLGR